MNVQKGRIMKRKHYSKELKSKVALAALNICLSNGVLYFVGFHFVTTLSRNPAFSKWQDTCWIF